MTPGGAVTLPLSAIRDFCKDEWLHGQPMRHGERYIPLCTSCTLAFCIDTLIIKEKPSFVKSSLKGHVCAQKAHIWYAH